MYDVMIYSKKIEVQDLIWEKMKVSRKEAINVVAYDDCLDALSGAVQQHGYDISIYHVTNREELHFAHLAKIFCDRTNIIYVIENRHMIVPVAFGEPYSCIFLEDIDEHLNDVLDNAMARVLNKQKIFFEYKRGRDDFLMDINEVLYFYSERRLIRIKHKDLGEDGYYGKLDDVEAAIAKKTNMFVRVSKSFLINKKYVHYVENGEIVMTDGRQIKATKSYDKNANNYIIDC